MYEGAPNHPEPDRFWEIISRHKVSKLRHDCEGSSAGLQG